MVKDREDYTRKVYIPMSFLALDDTPITFEGVAKRTVVVNDSETAVEFSDFSADDHSARHEEGGADEVTGITGKLNNHSVRHEEGGADEVTGITGKLNDHSARHENGGADEISVAGLSGELADRQDPKDHASRHENGGADEISVRNLPAGTGSSAGSLDPSGSTNIYLNAYSFFPMLSGNATLWIRLTTSTGSADNPRFCIVNTVDYTVDYDIRWRYCT